MMFSKFLDHQWQEWEQLLPKIFRRLRYGVVIYGATAIALTVLAHHGWAQQDTTAESVKITAEDGMIWKRAETTIRAFRDVRIEHQDLLVRSDRSDIFYSEEEPSGFSVNRLEAMGSVIITQGSLRVTADTANYFLQEEIFTAHGKPVVLTRDASEAAEIFTLRSAIIRFQNNQVIAEENATAAQNDWTVTGHRIVVMMDEDRNPVSFSATGQTQVQSGEVTVQADRVDYRIAEGVANFEGNVSIHQGGGSVTGPRGFLNTKTNVGRIDGKVKATILQ